MGGTPQKCAPLSVMLTVKDMGRTIAFYRDILGFRLAESFPDTNPPMWANMMLGEQSIMLGLAMDPESGGCGEMDASQKAYFKSYYDDYTSNKPGAGIIVYVQVDDVDAFHHRVVTKGLKAVGKPTSQFYGIRDFWASDPDGFRLVFYKPIQMASCQSCGMPLKDAAPGVMLCQYCSDEHGKLRPYEQIFEGTVTGYFMAMQKLPRPQAEQAATKHLASMPAWKAMKT